MKNLTNTTNTNKAIDFNKGIDFSKVIHEELDPLYYSKSGRRLSWSETKRKMKTQIKRDEKLREANDGLTNEEIDQLRQMMTSTTEITEQVVPAEPEVEFNKKEETNMNIQEILNNDIIEQTTMVELAIDSNKRDTLLNELCQSRINLGELKTTFEDLLKDSYNYKEISDDYKRIKASPYIRPDYSLKDYIDDKFSVELYYMTSPLSIDEPFLTDLYYNEEDDYNMLDFMSGEIGYDNPEDCLSISAMLTYFRDCYEATINEINEVIDHTLKIEMLLVRLHNELIDNPNTLTLLKMAYA